MQIVPNKYKKNPFKDMGTMLRLNPYHLVMQRKQLLQKLTDTGLDKERDAVKGVSETYAPLLSLLFTLSLGVNIK